MMPNAQPDQLSDGGEDYIYRDGNWTTLAGYCVNTAYAHKLTLKFYARHGRSPFTPKPVPKPRVTAKATRAKTAAVRAAVAKALAAKSGKAATKVAKAKIVTPARAKRASKKS
ncbi:MAG: hypothetical protein DRI90_25800 [Deltaproteobacteria bacterium]|nr:MAG: hypothetical protein DRI90_25800 [Deltaproteobacteria bacterium]